ncbi:MAG: PEP-CTERM sorting domain-containing protein [Janthinobacterium lividum]
MKTNFSTILAGVAIAFAAAGAQAEVIVSDTTYRNFDKSSGYVSFNVDTHGLIGDLNVAIEFSKCDNPYLGKNGRDCESDDTPFENEIVFHLIGPDGRIVRLVEPSTFDQGATGGIGRVTMTFSDEGQALGRRVQAGTYRPVEALSAFDGMDMFGVWKLFLQDTTASDPLEVYASRLIFNAADEPPVDVPEPGSVAVFGAGLLGLAVLRRRRPAR